MLITAGNTPLKHSFFFNRGVAAQFLKIMYKFNGRLRGLTPKRGRRKRFPLNKNINVFVCDLRVLCAVGS